MTARVALYCRVSTSTKDQTTENQLRELQSYCDRMGYEVVKVYEDEVSGAKSREKRPAYSKLCKDAFLKKFDIIIGWDVSRFGRSMKVFVSFLSDMDEKGIGVIAVKNGLDTDGQVQRYQNLAEVHRRPRWQGFTPPAAGKSRRFHGLICHRRIDKLVVRELRGFRCLRTAESFPKIEPKKPDPF